MAELLTHDSIDYDVAGHSMRDIVNYNEFEVLRAMRKLFAKDVSFCQCNLCTEDIYALALNSLPPRYIQASSVRSYRESVNFIDERLVAEKVQESVAKVRRNPNHG
ncbi:MAG: late competence development ComFB family protein [Deltaproteobacteria bacterium]|nr:late competence development ComFB family protein [Deltaproteobacteria bacterium]